LSEFMGMNQPYLYFKQNSSLKRTYYKCKLIPKPKNKTELH